jgi:tetratricopeptide (TPR) repeat protein
VTRGSIGEPESYQFKHALVRDAAHDSLLRAKRESLHRKLAKALAARRAEDHDVPAELIALHFVEGAAPDRSVKFWIEAAHTALARGGQCEAAQFCRQGLGAVQEMSDPVQRSAFECDLQLLLYGAEYSRGDVGLLLGILERAEELAGRLEDPPRLSKVLDMKAYTLASAGRVADGIEAGRQAVAINRDLDDANAFIGANMMLGRALYAAGEYREAVIQARLVRDMLGEDLERGYIAGAMNQTVSSRVWLTFMQAEVGAFDAAEQDIRDAFGLLERMAVNNHERIWAAAAFGRLRHLRGDHAAVIEWLEPLLDLCESEFPVYLARMAMSLGPALVANGQEGRGLELLKRGDELAGANRFKFAHGLLLAELARSLLQAGDAAGAEEIARRAVAVSERAGEGGNAAWARLAAGEAAQAAGSQGEARRLIEAAAGRAEQQGMVPLTRCCRRALPTLGSRALALDLR